ncbi:hypothetical protein [Nitrospira sp. Nam74]
MSAPDSQIITARLLDLQRTVERLSRHVNDLQSQLVKSRGIARIPKSSSAITIWQRLAGWRVQPTGRPVRENRRKLSHAIHST